MSTTTFSIQNTTGKVIKIIHEPECFEFDLQRDDEIEIETSCCLKSILLKISNDADSICLSILDENSLYSVKQNGQDVFSKFMESYYSPNAGPEGG